MGLRVASRPLPLNPPSRSATITLLLGLAAGLGTVEVVPTEIMNSDSIIETYGALVQHIIDDDSR